MADTSKDPRGTHTGARTVGRFRTSRARSPRSTSGRPGGTTGNEALARREEATVTDQMTDEQSAWIDQLIRSIKRDELARDSGTELAESEADADVADRLADRLGAGPVRVRVDARRSYWGPGMPPGSDIRGFTDYGRVGWVRRPCARTGDGGYSVYVEDMSPGDDDNPTRYHRPSSLIVLDD
jgi:hypothetical protein